MSTQIHVKWKLCIKTTGRDFLTERIEIELNQSEDTNVIWIRMIHDNCIHTNVWLNV